MLIAIAMVSMAASCSKEPVQPTVTVTGAASHISCRSAEIAGRANLPQTASKGLSFGVLYSTSSGVIIGTATRIEARSFDSGCDYSVNTELLEPETTYYYRSYAIQDTEISYGELKSFTTLAVSSMIRTLDATEINPKDAVLNASLDLTDCIYDELEYGFEVTPEGGSAYTIKSDDCSGNKFSAKDESLSRDTKYSAVAYVMLDGRTYKGEVKNFSTKSIQASVTAEASDAAYHSVTISGRLTVESEGVFEKSAELYYSSTANTLDALKSGGTKMLLTFGADGAYSINLSSLVSDTRYNYVVVSNVDDVEFVSDIRNFVTQTPPSGFIDLGLSVFWATCNLDASKPEDYGGYYQWAGLENVTDRSICLDWDNCPYHTGSSYLSGWTKYVPAEEPSFWAGPGNPDNKSVLDPDDEVARARSGGSWRMPTVGEWKELTDVDNCSWTWTSLGGVDGFKVQSKKPGFTDKWIFLPAAGCRCDDNLKDAGSEGYYWSSSLDIDSPGYASSLYFYSFTYCTFSHSRCNGQSVRPVSDC